MEYDVIIVGAGPAGSTCAKFLSEKNINVLLVDKEKFPRNKCCGGGLPAKVLNHFSYIKENKLIDEYNYGGCIYSSSLKYKLKVTKDEPIIATVLREKFDNELVKLAVDSGTKFKDEKKVNDIKITNEKAMVIFDDGSKAESEIIVGADGVWSTVAKKSGLFPEKNQVSVSLYNEYKLSIKTMDEYYTKKRYGHMHLKVLGIPGYGWVFPKKEHVNIGIGIVDSKAKKNETKRNLKDIYKDYFLLLKNSKIIPKDLEIGEIKGAALPRAPRTKTYANRIILVGDAAGLINPLTGEGIDYAMVSGKIASEVIVEALQKNNTSEKFLSKYEKFWKKQFGKDIKLFLAASKRWNNQNEKFIKRVCLDKKLSDMAFDIISGNISINKVKWKLIKRYLYGSILNVFKKN